jgi:adenosylmethionine---8-amino-7-oxononanoate aminotransferase
MKAETRRLQNLDQKRIWHPFTQMEAWLAEDPLVIVKGDGAYLIDSEDRRYLDGISSLWTNVHGHRHPLIDQAVKEQLDQIAHTTLLGLAGSASVEFAEKLCSILPDGLERIFYSDNGSTAAEIALKMAFTFQRRRGGEERSKFITFDGAYHGDTIGSVSLGGIDIFHSAYKPLLFETIQLPYPHCYRCPLAMSPTDCGKSCFEEIASAIRKHASDCAGVVTEPLIQGAAGMRTAPKGFLRLLRDLCDELNLLLVADEVATGFGRTGTMFACEQEGVVPDLMALAKGITGGYLPLAVTAVKQKVFEAFLGRHEEFKTFFHGHTYTGNPLACAAGLGNLRVFAEEKVLDAEPAKIERLANNLKNAQNMDFVGDVRQAGFMIGIELVSDKKTKTPFPAAMRLGHQVSMKAREKGLIIRPLGDVVVLNPPLCVTNEQIDFLTQATLDSIKEVLADF